MKPRLTDRDMTILRLYAEGKSVAHIAKSLKLTIGTVRVMSSGLYKRIGVKNRVAAGAWYRHHGPRLNCGSVTLRIENPAYPIQCVELTGDTSILRGDAEQLFKRRKARGPRITFTIDPRDLVFYRRRTQ